MEGVREKYNALLAKEPPKGAPCKNMKTFLLCCALVVLLVIIMIVVSVETNKQLQPQTETCQQIYGNDPDHGPVGCRVCQQGARSNDISGLPFYNLGAKSVSHNLGVYNLVTFNGSSVTSNVGSNIIQDIIAVRGGNSPSDPGNYVQALGLYFVFAILMCILTTLCGCGVCLCKFCCNCACCGRRYPTEKGSFLGFEYMKDTQTFQYSPLGIWSTRIFMGTFAFFLALWLGLGQVNGNLGMTSSMKALTHAPDGLVSVMRGVVQPIAQLLEDLISHTFVGLFQDLNHTVTTKVNLGGILDGVQCIMDLLGGFPTSDTLRLFIDDLQSHFHNLTDMLSSRVPGVIANLTGELDVVRAQIVDLRDVVNEEFGHRLILLIANLTLLQDRIDNFNNFTSHMLNPACCSSKAMADLDQLQASRNNISESEYDNMTTILALVSLNTTTSADYVTFLAQMQKAQVVMAGLPNFNHSADELEAHNAIVQQAIDDRVAPLLIDAIVETNEFLLSTHGFTDSLNYTVQLLIGNVSVITLDPIRGIILDFNNSIASMPGFSILDTFLASVLGIKDRLIPCMLDVADELKQFDLNIAELPQQFLQIDSIIRTVNETLEPALNAVDDVEERKREFQNQTKLFDIDKQLADVARTEQELQNYTNQVRDSNYLQTVRNAEDKSNLNITTLPDIENVNASLPGWIIPDENITNVRILEPFRAGLNLDLPILNVDLPLMLGYCSNNFSRPCNTASPGGVCGPGTCKGPFRRCANDESPCSYDANCTTPHRCLGDVNRVNRTIINLKAMEAAVYAPNSFEDTSNMLAGARDSAQINTTGLEIGVAEANTTLRSVETGSLTQDLTNVIESLDQFNSSDFTKQLDDINATLNAIDFASIIANLDSLDGNFQAIDNERQNLDVANTFLNATRELFFTRLPEVIDSFSVAKLSGIRRTQGVAATLDYLATTIDRETAWLDRTAVSVLNLTGGATFSTNFTASLAPYHDLVYTICDASYSTYGSAYYLYEVANAMSYGGSVGATIFTPNGAENRIDVDQSGRVYPGGAICITSRCLENSIDWVNSAPLSEVSSGMVPVNLSREQVIGLPYLVPLAILICATLSTALFCRTSQIGWWSSSLACCTCYGAFCCMPIIFIIVGMAFPLVIISGDICYSAENVGYNLLAQQGNQICETMGGFAAGANCEIPWTFRNVTRNATVNILGTYASLVAPGCNPNSGAIYDGFEQAKDAFADMPSILIANFINNNTNTSSDLPINFRWPVKQIFVDAAADLSIRARTFGTGLQRALSCSQLYRVYASFKGAVCCDVVSAFYWALGSWYLIAWTLLCCGCCAGLLGRKRFAYELWGAEIMAIKDKVHMEGEQDDNNGGGKRYSESEGDMHKEQKHDDHHSELVSAPTQQTELVKPPQQPEYVPPPSYVAPPEYKDAGEMEMVSAPTTKTVEDF